MTRPFALRALLSTMTIAFRCAERISPMLPTRRIASTTHDGHETLNKWPIVGVFDRSPRRTWFKDQARATTDDLSRGKAKNSAENVSTAVSFVNRLLQVVRST